MKPLAALLLALSCTPLHAATISPEVRAIVLAIGEAKGVPRSVVEALMLEESGGDPDAVKVERSGWTSEGLYQLYTEPEHIAYLVRLYFPHKASAFDIRNPIDNAVVALGYLGALHRRFENWTQALWYFNSGEYMRVLVPKSTQAYARRIIEAR